MPRTFVRKKKMISFRSLLESITALDMTCDEGWFLIERTHKCYIFLSTNKRISFVDAQHQCESKNSSVFKIIPDSEDVLPANVHSYNIVGLVKQAYYNIHYIKLDHNFVSQAIHGSLLHSDYTAHPRHCSFAC